MQRFILTVIGHDQPGLVDSLSSAIENAGGNWLESRLCHLGGHFTGLVHLELPDERALELQKALGEIKGLTLHLHPDRAQLACLETFTMELIGQDRPGIVRQITHALACHEVNVEDLVSEVLSAPMSGEQLFKARLVLGLPQGAKLAAIQASVEKIAEDLMCDISFDAQKATV